MEIEENFGELSGKFHKIPKIPGKFSPEISRKFPENSRKNWGVFNVKYNFAEQKSAFLFL